MDTKKEKITTVEAYLANYSDEQQQLLNQIRAAIKEAVPGIEERISYGVLGFFAGKPVVYLSMNKRHIGMYPKTAALEAALQDELAPYIDKTSKGTIRFQLNKPIPYDLIARIVKIRKEENG